MNKFKVEKSQVQCVATRIYYSKDECVEKYVVQSSQVYGSISFNFVGILSPFMNTFSAANVAMNYLGQNTVYEQVYESEYTLSLFLATAFHFHAIYLHFQSPLFHISQ